MRAASRFVVPLGAVALGSALVAASTNVSSHNTEDLHPREFSPDSWFGANPGPDVSASRRGIFETRTST